MTKEIERIFQLPEDVDNITPEFLRMLPWVALYVIAFVFIMQFLK